jgi:hypothetical protein
MRQGGERPSHHDIGSRMTNSSAVPVRDVLVWLSRVDADAASRLLVGCALDDGSGDEAVPIVALDAERKAVTLEGGRRLLLAGARDGEIVDPRPDAPLGSVIAAQWTPDERRERQELAELAQAGIDADQLASGDDRRAVLAVLRAMAAGTLPDPEQRRRFYAALSAAGEPRLARTGAHLLEQLAEQFRVAGTVPDDLYWGRTWLLRASRQLREAVSVSDALHLGLVKDQGARKLLATIRAAVLLDLFEATGEAKWLGLADRAARVASAIAPAEEEVKAVNRRLETMRAQAARG